MKRKNFIPTKASLVCSDHFRHQDYIFKPGMRKRRLKSHAVPSIFNFPVKDYMPIEFVRKLDSTPLQPNSKRGGKKGRMKTEKKRKSCIELLSVVKLVEGFDEYDDTVSFVHSLIFNIVSPPTSVSDGVRWHPLQISTKQPEE